MSATSRARLTARDLAILASLRAARYLTVEHLQWIHWAAPWRRAYRAARASGQICYGPTHAYRRIRLLAQHQLIQPVTRSATRGQTIYRRAPTCYTLTRLGAAVLADTSGSELDLRDPVQTLFTLEHSVAIGACYAALRAELEYRGLQLADWRGDHLLATAYDTVVVPSEPRPLPVIPDATFVLHGERYVVEVDRGTSKLAQWRTKALAYRAYQGSPALAARYGTAALVVLVVVPHATRMHAIARTIAEVHQGVAAYRFLVSDHVHPTTIRRSWQGMQRVAFVHARRRESHMLQAEVTLGEMPLWMPSDPPPGR